MQLLKTAGVTRGGNTLLGLERENTYHLLVTRAIRLQSFPCVAHTIPSQVESEVAEFGPEVFISPQEVESSGKVNSTQ